MGKKINFLIITIIILFFTACFSDKKDKEYVDEDKNMEKDITYIVYFAADNNLSAAAIEDLKEISKATSDKLNVVCFIDMNEEYLNNTFYVEKTYNSKEKFLGIDKIKVLKEFENKNSGDWETLKDFLDYVYDNYRSKKYILSIWSHGDGWYDDYKNTNPFSRGIGVDDRALKDKLNLWEIESAVYFSKIKKLDILYLDACLMGAIETAYQLRNISEYLIMSTDKIPITGGDYTSMLNYINNNTEKSNKDIALNMNIINFNYYKNKSDSFINFILINQNQADEFYEKFKKMAENLKNFENYNKSIHNNDIMRYNNKEGNYYDIGDYLKKISNLNEIESHYIEEFIKELSDRDKYIVDLKYKTLYYNNNLELHNNFISGLSVYIKFNLKDVYYSDEYYKNSCSFPLETGWYDLIKN